MTHAVLGLFIALGLAEPLAGGEPSLIGSDVAAAFERASKGAPLRYVALGGSITQAGDGWIGPWLRRQFPNSRVTVVNSGMSATGSALGVFRVERDVIAHQPDLVAIEFCVNDGGLNDEDAVRYLESLIVRLKRLPQPPAIIILEAAAADGVNLKRHRQVARHYDLLEIDLQKAVNDELGKSGRTWDAYFSDDVHPNAEGHSYYARVIEEKLTPFLGNSAVRPETALPPPMSRKPLLMDGRMVAISGLAGAPGWKTESSPEIWWNRFFNGLLTADAPGSAFQIPFRGSTAGLLYAMDKSHGTFYANVDGGVPRIIGTNTRGRYSYAILSGDLPAREHVLNVALPPAADSASNRAGPVKLGYLLVAGETKASREQSPQGPLSEEALGRLNFTPVPANAWSWAGPFLADTITERDARSALSSVLPPETGKASQVDWRPIPPQTGPWIDLRKLTGTAKPAVAFATATVEIPDDRNGFLSLAIHYFAKIWVNGQLVATLDDSHGEVASPVIIPVTLRRGKNHILLKVGAGSKGFGFSLSIGNTIP
jgi:lysophospholipase L1-like esterase